MPDATHYASDPNPFLSAALDAAAGVASPKADNVSNVATSLEFLLARVVGAQDPLQCYAEDLIRCVAASTGSEAREAGRKLKLTYGKDINLNQWNSDVRAARAELIKAGPDNGFIRSDSGTIKPILANAIIQLGVSPLRVAYDSFSSRVTVCGRSPWGTEGPWRDIDDSAAAEYLQHHAVPVNSATANEAAYMIAYRNQFHPVRDWLARLKWDGEPRLETWLGDYLGADDSAYTRAVGAKWMVSAVARIMRPGCKADYMIVLEGPQGQRKSMALRALTNGHLEGDSGQQWFRDALPDIEKDDIGLYMQGVWIIEVAELEAIRGKQWTRVKAFLSSQADNFRRKYGRNMQDYPRQCIFAGSTNEQHWAGDPTGARRFWPVAASRVDIDGLLRWRDQLWAEARYRYDEGETWWLDSETEKDALEVQQDRGLDDPWVERVGTKLTFVDDASVREILDMLNIPIDRQDMGTAAKVGRALGVLGWERYRKRLDAGRVWRYRKA